MTTEQVSLFAGPGETERRGIVRKTRFRNEDNGFSIVFVEVYGDQQTWAGIMPKLRDKSEVQGFGKDEPSRYGPQFKVSSVAPIDPTTSEGIAEFLGSGLVAGIGATLAARIVAHYGADTLRVLEHELDRVKCDVRGIGAAKLEALRTALIEHKAVGQIMIWLRGHGATASLATKLYKRYGSQAITILSETPYRMCMEVDGIGWKTADDLAQQLGTPANAPDRIQAGLLHTLDEATGRGHCYQVKADLVGQAAELLGLASVEVDPMLPHLCNNEHVVIIGDAFVYPRKLHNAERNVAQRLHTLLTTPTTKGRLDSGDDAPTLHECVNKAIAEFETRTGFTMATSQRDAVKLVANSKVVVVTGGPGTGKALSGQTTILTLNGWRPINSLQVGDPIIGRDGKTYNVVGVYPQGVRPIYRVTMEDGGWVDADDEHLWQVVVRGVLRVYKTTTTTQQLRESIDAGIYSEVRLPWAATDTTPPKQRHPSGRLVQSIVPNGETECTCIAVDAPDKLFVVQHHIVTHNTTITKAVLDTISMAGLDVSLVAPTGRAAKRMGEATNYDASTIHRFLSYDPEKRGFAFDKTNKHKTQVLIADEVSMMDVQLTSSLLDALRDDARVIFVGDVDQLPSVGPGSVLRDIIESGVVPTARLSVVYRQAEGSLIIDNAHRINKGEKPINGPPRGDFYVLNKDNEGDVAAMVETMVRDRIPATYGFDPLTQVQVLSPMNKGPAGVIALNERLQAAINPPDVDKPEVKRGKTIFRLGDRVLQTKNDYERGVFNGDIGFVMEVMPEATKDEPVLFVEIDGSPVPYTAQQLENCMLAYCTSIHRSQGGQQKAVIVLMLMSHFMMLSRNLLYTAVTRGEKLVVLVTEPRALGMALAETRKELRRTKLAQRLQLLADPGLVARKGAAKVLAVLRENTVNDVV